ncbi:hypothetical protein F4809DRAFT_266562 [Biscogniauxia mediterranea]|nr:hypothetical protein F4809DRAFT_266562 [Biscogniauxia mediterranea]
MPRFCLAYNLILTLCSLPCIYNFEASVDVIAFSSCLYPHGNRACKEFKHHCQSAELLNKGRSNIIPCSSSPHGGIEIYRNQDINPDELASEASLNGPNLSKPSILQLLFACVLGALARRQETRCNFREHISKHEGKI